MEDELFKLEKSIKEIIDFLKLVPWMWDVEPSKSDVDLQALRFLKKQENIMLEQLYITSQRLDKQLFKDMENTCISMLNVYDSAEMAFWGDKEDDNYYNYFNNLMNNTKEFLPMLRELRSRLRELLSQTEIVSTIKQPNTNVTRKQPDLSDTEKNTIETLGTKTMTGEQLAKALGYPYNSNFKSTLASLRKRKILGNKSPGYFLEPEYHFLLGELD